MIGKVITIAGTLEGAAFPGYGSVQCTNNLWCYGMSIDQAYNVHSSLVSKWKQRMNKETCKTKQVCAGFTLVFRRY